MSLSWSIVRTIFCKSTEPVEVPVSDAIVSLVSKSKVPWTSKFTVSAKLPSPCVKFATVYRSISRVPEPDTWSKKSYVLEFVPSANKVNVLLPKLITVVVDPFAAPNLYLPVELTDPSFWPYKTEALPLRVTKPVKVVWASVSPLSVKVAAVPLLKLLLPEPARLIFIPYVLPDPVPW